MSVYGRVPLSPLSQFHIVPYRKKFEVVFSDGLPGICAEVQPCLIDSGPIKLPQRCTPTSPALMEIEFRKIKPWKCCLLQFSTSAALADPDLALPDGTSPDTDLCDWEEVNFIENSATHRFLSIVGRMAYESSSCGDSASFDHERSRASDILRLPRSQEMGTLILVSANVVPHSCRHCQRFVPVYKDYADTFDKLERP